MFVSCESLASQAKARPASRLKRSKSMPLACPMRSLLARADWNCVSLSGDQADRSVGGQHRQRGFGVIVERVGFGAQEIERPGTVLAGVDDRSGRRVNLGTHNGVRVGDGAVVSECIGDAPQQFSPIFL